MNQIYVSGSGGKSSLVKWLGLAIAVLIAGLGAILGFWQHIPAQEVILYSAATFALVSWVWRAYAGQANDESYLASLRGEVPRPDADKESAGAEVRKFVKKNQVLLVASSPR
jgi:ribose transport system permease protein